MIALSRLPITASWLSPSGLPQRVFTCFDKTIFNIFLPSSACAPCFWLISCTFMFLWMQVALQLGFFCNCVCKTRSCKHPKISLKCSFCVLRVRAYIQSIYLPKKLWGNSELIQAPYEKAYSAAHYCAFK